MGLPAHNERMISFGDTLDAYLSFYASGDSNTERAKKYDCETFREFFGSLRIEEITQCDVRKYLEHRERAGEAPATIERRFATLRHLFRFARERFGIIVDPCRGLRGPRVVYGLPKRVPQEQIRAIESALTGDTYRDFKALIAFQLLLGTGIRRDELRRIEMRHLDLDKGLITGLTLKGGISEPIVIPARVVQSLREFLPLRNEHLHRHGFRYASVPERIKERYPLLCSTYNAKERNPFVPEEWRVDDKTIYDMISKLGKATGKHIHPHQLRHTFGDRVMKATQNPRLAAKALHHRTLNHVMRYTELNEEEIRKVINEEGFDEK